MNSLLLFLSEHQEPAQMGQLFPKDLDRVREWFFKWTGKENTEEALSLLSWLYIHEDIDMEASLFQDGAEYVKLNYGIEKKNFLDCIREARNLIFEQ